MAKSPGALDHRVSPWAFLCRETALADGASAIPRLGKLTLSEQESLGRGQGGVCHAGSVMRRAALQSETAAGMEFVHLFAYALGRRMRARHARELAMAGQSLDRARMRAYIKDLLLIHICSRACMRDRD